MKAFEGDVCAKRCAFAWELELGTRLGIEREVLACYEGSAALLRESEVQS